MPHLEMQLSALADDGVNVEALRLVRKLIDAVYLVAHRYPHFVNSNSAGDDPQRQFILAWGLHETWFCDTIEMTVQTLSLPSGDSVVLPWGQPERLGGLLRQSRAFGVSY